MEWYISSPRSMSPEISHYDSTSLCNNLEKLGKISNFVLNINDIRVRMGRIDIVRFRKSRGFSQRKLADMLDIKPSFLSAIENGRSRLPEDKLEKLYSIYGKEVLGEFYIEESQESVVPPHTHIHDEGDSLTQLLNHFHNLAHQRSGDHSGKEKELSERIESLTVRNDRLSNRLDDLRDEVDSLRTENLRLKELLLQHGISYS